MVETDELSAVCLPESLLKDTVTCRIPCQEVVAEKSACIARVRIEAPVGVVDVVIEHIISKELHPLLILGSVNEAAPLTDKERSYILIVDISPCIVPVIVKESLSSKVLVEPCLRVYGRAVVVR